MKLSLLVIGMITDGDTISFTSSGKACLFCRMLESAPFSLTLFLLTLVILLSKVDCYLKILTLLLELHYLLCVSESDVQSVKVNLSRVKDVFL